MGVLESIRGESAVARSQVMNYENFLFAMWIFENFKDNPLKEKKQVVELLRKTVDEQEMTVYDYIRRKIKAPLPSHPKWLEALESVKSVAGNSILDDANMDDLRAKIGEI